MERTGAFRADELERRVDKERGIEIGLVYQTPSHRANVFVTFATHREFHATTQDLHEELVVRLVRVFASDVSE